MFRKKRYQKQKRGGSSRPADIELQQDGDDIAGDVSVTVLPTKTLGSAIKTFSSDLLWEANHIMDDGDSWEPSVDEFLIEDIGYPIQENATRGKFDKLPIITQDGILLKKTEVPKLKQYVAGNNRALVRNGWLKFKIERYKQPSNQFMKTYNGLKMGKNLYGAPVTAKVLELYKLMDGIHYTRYHDVQSSLKKLPCLSKVSFAEINHSLANSFGGSDPVAVTRSFWNLIEKLPIDKHRTGRGLLIPYPVIAGDANLDDDVVRSNLDLNNLDSPLLQLENQNQSDRRFPEQRGVTRPIISCGFPASFSATRIQDGPAPASVDIILLGGVKCCLVVPARYFNKARKCLIRDLLSLNLAKTDHLLTNDFRCIMQHKNLLLGPEFYNRHGIPYSVVHQKAGEIMVIGSKASHCDVTCAASAWKTCCAVFSDFNFSYVDDFKQCECPRDVVEDNVDWNKRKDIEPTHSEPSGPGRVTKTGRYFAQPKDIEMLLDGSETLLDEMYSKKSERVKKEKGKYTYREDKKWICSNCFKHFTKERGLNEHRKKSCNKYGVCRREGCNKTFDRKERFEKHERWHQEEDKKQDFVTPMKTVHQPSLSHTSRKTKKRSSLSISNNDESEKDSLYANEPPASIDGAETVDLENEPETVRGCSPKRRALLATVCNKNDAGTDPADLDYETPTTPSKQPVSDHHRAPSKYCCKKHRNQMKRKKVVTFSLRPPRLSFSTTYQISNTESGMSSPDELSSIFPPSVADTTEEGSQLQTFDFDQTPQCKETHPSVSADSEETNQSDADPVPKSKETSESEKVPQSKETSESKKVPQSKETSESEKVVESQQSNTYQVVGAGDTPKNQQVDTVISQASNVPLHNYPKRPTLRFLKPRGVFPKKSGIEISHRNILQTSQSVTSSAVKEIVKGVPSMVELNIGRQLPKLARLGTL